MPQISVVDGYIVGYATQGGFVGGIDVTTEFIESLDKDKLCSYKYENGEALISEIRQQRRTECFPIINRGKPWYDTLTAEQVEELNTWYHNWLNAPETKSVPQKPEWIKE